MWDLKFIFSDMWPQHRKGLGESRVEYRGEDLVVFTWVDSGCSHSKKQVCEGGVGRVGLKGVLGEKRAQGR